MFDEGNHIGDVVAGSKTVADVKDMSHARSLQPQQAGSVVRKVRGSAQALRSHRGSSLIFGIQSTEGDESLRACGSRRRQIEQPLLSASQMSPSSSPEPTDSEETSLTMVFAVFLHFAEGKNSSRVDDLAVVGGISRVQQATSLRNVSRRSFELGQSSVP